jgi:hypothetical protein
VTPVGEFWLYDDTASLSIAGRSDYVERPDFASDDALIDRFLAMIEHALAAEA